MDSRKELKVILDVKQKLVLNNATPGTNATGRKRKLQ